VSSRPLAESSDRSARPLDSARGDKDVMKKILANALLAFVAMLLAAVLMPVSFVFVGFRPLAESSDRSARGDRKVLVAKMLFELARGIDQTGNAVCFDFFNWALVKDDGLAPFGNVDETISSVIGRNKQLENLTWVGRLLDLILDGIDFNHTIKSIGN